MKKLKIYVIYKKYLVKQMLSKKDMKTRGHLIYKTNYRKKFKDTSMVTWFKYLEYQR